MQGLVGASVPTLTPRPRQQRITAPGPARAMARTGPAYALALAPPSAPPRAAEVKGLPALEAEGVGVAAPMLIITPAKITTRPMRPCTLAAALGPGWPRAAGRRWARPTAGAVARLLPRPVPLAFAWPARALVARLSPFARPFRRAARPPLVRAAALAPDGPSARVAPDIGLRAPPGMTT